MSVSVCVCDGENVAGDENRSDLFCNATNFELLTFANFANQNRGGFLFVFDDEEIVKTMEKREG